MKRPEGVSGPASTPPAMSPTPPARADRAAKARKPAPASPATRTPAPPPVAPKRAAPDPVSPPRDSSTRTAPGASRDRSAKAEFRAAERARKRFERAEVKRFTRRARRRRAGWFAAALIALGLMGLVLAAVFSPLLALRTITVDGTSRLDSAKLEKAVDGQLGTPLALLDYGRITRELSAFRLIRSYSTEVLPPDTLVIHVVERAPVGAIQSATAFDLVDPAGVVVDSSATRPAGYPLIQLGNGRLDGPGFASMTQVLRALPAALLAKVDTITAQTRDDVTLSLVGSNQRVVWGSSDDSDAKAQVLADLIVLHGGDGPGEYDVSAPGTAVFHRDGS
ncbi:FtsQ-type POTRA domain-containing protein [Lysinimonas soli]|uniref:FtsQ-type POTRA domain-containing protein n=1 Tax=Lysinimonas soli TaxID=1074233 RepID=A0ABW0NN89_9MICO